MGFETIKVIMEANAVQATVDQAIKDNPTECPDCAWPLKVNSAGQKACPICERVWS
ncbi:MAG: hypothetical protein PHI12_08845 [Dehalococcoidales bacterium]|nr:hypothetical protein [Dehalococcoidales bacterium]